MLWPNPTPPHEEDHERTRVLPRSPQGRAAGLPSRPPSAAEGPARLPPHERSPSAAQIAWTLTSELRACCDLAATSRVDWNPTPPPTLDEIVADFERHDGELDALVAGLEDEAWRGRGQFLVGTRVAMEQPVGDLLWLFLFDGIHHRGQLSTYLRPMGGKVPSIYGPSGDEAGT